MSTNRHERPGVYSSYDASSVVSGGGSGGTVGLAAVSEAEAGKVYTLSRYEDAVSQLGAGDRMTGLVRLLFLNGAAQVKAVAVAEESGYEGAFALLQGEEEIAVVVCDSTALAVQQKLRASVEDASAARRERIAVVSGALEETVSEMVERAEALNSERVVLVAPGGGDEVAAVAGAIAGERDPAVPLGGAVLRGVEALTRNFDDGELDALIRGGVTPLEAAGGQVSVVRGVTTRTKSGEVADATWRELTRRIADDGIPAGRSALRARFRRAKTTEQSRGAIRSQVVLELENKLTREIITGYDGVRVEADTENPTVCLVDFSFTVAHGLNQIWVSAHITV